MTPEEYLERIAARTVSNTENIQQKDRQRRHSFVDLYGVEFTRQGDANNPATFYVSISPDMVYMERFEFKLIVSPFLSANGVGTSISTPVIDATELTAELVKTGSEITGVEITPNPHTHELSAHTHGLNPGVGSTPAASGDYRLYIEGIDVTPYLMAQHDWVSGEGVWPSLVIGEDYDMLEVASDLVAEGKKGEADLLTSSGYKRVQITGPGPFSVTLVNYLKYSHRNR